MILLYNLAVMTINDMKYCHGYVSVTSAFTYVPVRVCLLLSSLSLKTLSAGEERIKSFQWTHLGLNHTTRTQMSEWIDCWWESGEGSSLLKPRSIPTATYMYFREGWPLHFYKNHPQFMSLWRWLIPVNALIALAICPVVRELCQWMSNSLNNFMNWGNSKQVISSRGVKVKLPWNRDIWEPVGFNCRVNEFRLLIHTCWLGWAYVIFENNICLYFRISQKTFR